MSLHEDEAAVDADLVARLLGEQMPHPAHLPPMEVGIAGSVNAMHRIGAHPCTRIPRTQPCAADLQREQRWLGHLAAHLPLAVPEVVATGAPGQGYLYPWVDGNLYDPSLITDQVRAGSDLAWFVAALRAQPLVPDAPPSGRAPLAELDADTRQALARCTPGLGHGGVRAALAAWEQDAGALAWDGRAVRVHADLLPFNLTVVHGALHGVIDLGMADVGNPAVNIIAAWIQLDRAGRATFRQALDVESGTWARARACAMHEAANIIWFYRQIHPTFATSAAATIERVRSDQN